MAATGLDTRGLQVVPDAPTGRVQVTFEAGEPRYDILADQAYDRVDPAALAAAIADPVPLLYHGSLALRQSRALSRSAFVDWLGAAWTPDQVRDCLFKIWDKGGGRM
jgi:sugar/nucleoside kinase (ribokinase family)